MINSSSKKETVQLKVREKKKEGKEGGFIGLQFHTTLSSQVSSYQREKKKKEQINRQGAR